MKSTSLLFVCLGNICRSPSAEAVMQHLVDEAGLQDQLKLDSAGTIAFHAGKPADSRMKAHAQRRGINLTSISRKVTASDFTDFDYILAMDQQNYDDLRKMAPDEKARNKVERMLSYAPETGVTEVPDPYYGGAEGFETVLDLLEVACANLLKRVHNS